MVTLLNSRRSLGKYLYRISLSVGLIAGCASAQLNVPNGRFAFSHDGNNYDLDDYVASPMNLALLEGTGLKDRMVHFDHSCHLLNKSAQYAEMLESVNGGADRFNIDTSNIFDIQTDLSGAIANFKAEAEKSSASNPLWFCIAGPMEVPYRCIEAVDPAYHQYIYCVSHSVWNENHVKDSVGMTHTWGDIKADFPNVVTYDIDNQNNTGWNTDESNVYWMRDSDNPDLQWLYNRNAKDTYDSSDSGMFWWVITGGPNGGDDAGGWEDYKPILESIGEDNGGGSEATVQGEDYNSQSGLVNEGTHIGYINHNDWARYNGVDMTSGSQTISIRYSSAKTACTASLETTGGSVLATIDLPNTGDWNTWQTVTETVSFGSAVSDLVIKFKHPTGNTKTYLCNMDWFSYSASGSGSSDVVIIRKRNALGYALDGNWDGANGQNIYLWTYGANNINQKFEEIDRGGGYYSYQKVGTSYSLDGGEGGANKQNVYLWTTSASNYNQQWQKVDMGGGYYQLRKRNATGFALNGGSDGSDGQNVTLYDSGNSSYNLQWKVEYQ